MLGGRFVLKQVCGTHKATVLPPIELILMPGTVILRSFLGSGAARGLTRAIEPPRQLWSPLVRSVQNRTFGKQIDLALEEVLVGPQ